MATASDSSSPPPPGTRDHDEDEDGEFDDDDLDDEDEEDDNDDGEPSASPSEEARLEAVLRRLTAESRTRSAELNSLGGDIAVTAFANLSFDIPLKPLRDLGIHGHAFVCAGNLGKLTECGLQKFPLTNFLQTFRSSAGFGLA
ncbi:hypothetical protein BAE44_0016990 [Dichanthelium oligosanthes]|uniref:Uncharacterized protein n=1 Tax=Dichanthelium oligosanthes TaxID=888268 RepID=A0A1E5VA25_9POAL|nr:hypothetical protein BAE44_0016990 [Dichanthelium oligosanthes]